MSEPDRVLACQLLHACHALYAVDAGGLKASPWFPGAGFVADPVFVQKGPERIHAFIAGAHAAGIVVAFRGTLLPDPKGPLDRILRDWINDFNLALAPVAGLPGKVHAGVGEGHSLLLSELLAAVRTLAGANRPVIVTGHSKGGLLAAYAAVALHRAGIPVGSVYRFGSPRVGNRAFADACDAAVPAHWRFEARNDVVVHLPLRFGLAPIAQAVGARARGARFEDANLAGAVLEKASLEKAHLSGADLSGANLGRANLTNARLENARLGAADLRKARLRTATLRGASFAGARLHGADFTGADLSDAYLGGASTSNAVFTRPRTTGCKGCP